MLPNVNVKFEAMREEIEQILEDFNSMEIEPNEAIDKLLNLHSVSCCSKEQLEKEYGRGFSDGCEHARPAY